MEQAAVRAQVMQSYYVLLWAFERLATGVEVLERVQYREAINVLRRSVEWHAVEIGQNIVHVRALVSPSDDEAFARYQRCVRILKDAGMAEPLE